RNGVDSVTGKKLHSGSQKTFRSEKSKTDADNRKSIRNLASLIMSTPETYGSIETFQDLHRAMVSQLGNITETQLFDALRLPTGREISERQLEVKTQIDSIRTEVSSFEKLLRLVTDGIESA